METKAPWMLKQLKSCKTLLVGAAALAAPSALTVAYHSAVISLGRIDLNILELERYQQSYVEVSPDYNELALYDSSSV